MCVSDGRICLNALMSRAALDARPALLGGAGAALFWEMACQEAGAAQLIGAEDESWKHFLQPCLKVESHLGSAVVCLHRGVLHSTGQLHKVRSFKLSSAS